MSGSDLTPQQVADVQFAYGRSLEKRDQIDQAIGRYAEAVKQDPSRADAALRLAILHAKQGKFKESDEMFRQALALRPGDPDIFCNRGYSLYLQRRWTEAEADLRQALTLKPGHQRAHNNLGLVLAHSARADEALAEFREAGCSDADAHVNLAFVLTLERQWPEARHQYEKALACDPRSVHAKQGLEKLTTLVAKATKTSDGLSQGGGTITPVTYRTVPK